jgi:hypothetical protein
MTFLRKYVHQFMFLHCFRNTQMDRRTYLSTQNTLFYSVKKLVIKSMEVSSSILNNGFLRQKEPGSLHSVCSGEENKSLSEKNCEGTDVGTVSTASNRTFHQHSHKLVHGQYGYNLSKSYTLRFLPLLLHHHHHQQQQHHHHHHYHYYCRHLLDALFLTQVYFGFKFCTSVLEIIGLRVPVRYIRYFALFNVCSSCNNCSYVLVLTL